MRTLPLTFPTGIMETGLTGLCQDSSFPGITQAVNRFTSEQKLPFRNQAWGFGATKSGLPQDWDDYIFFFQFHSKQNPH